MANMSDAIRVGKSADNLKSIPRQPTEISYGLMDISSSDAGRVQDASATMYKMRTAQKRKLTLRWQGLSLAHSSKIFKAFNPEYIWVEYLDLKEGEWNVRKFYTGDKSASFGEIRLPCFQRASHSGGR